MASARTTSHPATKAVQFLTLDPPPLAKAGPAFQNATVSQQGPRIERTIIADRPGHLIQPDEHHILFWIYTISRVLIASTTEAIFVIIRTTLQKHTRNCLQYFCPLFADPTPIVAADVTKTANSPVLLQSLNYSDNVTPDQTQTSCNIYGHDSEEEKASSTV